MWRKTQNKLKLNPPPYLQIAPLFVNLYTFNKEREGSLIHFKAPSAFTHSLYSLIRR